MKDTHDIPRKLFEEAVVDLDAATANRLRLMRREALSATAPARPRVLLPALGFAAAVLAVGLGWRAANPPVPAGNVTAEPVPAIELASDEDAALYAWLGEAPVASEGETL